MDEAPRGIRNNNPFNIRISPMAWIGKLVPCLDDEFEQFDTPEDGIRAGIKILVNYYRLYGLQTVAEIIGRFAPSSENDTAAYANDVAYRMGVGVSDTLNMLSNPIIEQLATAIIEHENGQQPYSFSVIEDATNEVLATA